MSPLERVDELQRFHESFGRNAISFVSNLAEAVGSTVRVQTRISEIRARTSASLSQELLTEAYKEVVEQLRIQAQQSSELAAYLATNSAVAASIGGMHAAAGAALGGAFDGALTGSLFGRSKTGALVGALKAFSELRRQQRGNKRLEIALTYERIAVMDQTLRGVFDCAM
jgi:hypothetical protein